MKRHILRQKHEFRGSARNFVVCGKLWDLLIYPHVYSMQDHWDQGAVWADVLFLWNPCLSCASLMARWTVVVLTLSSHLCWGVIYFTFFSLFIREFLLPSINVAVILRSSEFLTFRDIWKKPHALFLSVDSIYTLNNYENQTILYEYGTECMPTLSKSTYMNKNCRK